ncbi:hypothetical protein P9A14_05310 [Gordonia hongkongensis]|uniref:O-antigen ligase domain-containing protein n=1 Tax=Gordonia hongkongensis TaxID=1701090 RepID=A0AAX3TAS0_9ACTN|nr:hypothetical protein [Gordonia hongkongensis]QIK49158.1 hypothetical protein G8C36_19445 [Gordonia terrae]WFP25931.1 hypothetical protein P9A14_05310 [Gordonia hongkongensis]
MAKLGDRPGRFLERHDLEGQRHHEAVSSTLVAVVIVLASLESVTLRDISSVTIVFICAISSLVLWHRVPVRFFVSWFLFLTAAVLLLGLSVAYSQSGLLRSRQIMQLVACSLVLLGVYALVSRLSYAHMRSIVAFVSITVVLACAIELVFRLATGSVRGSRFFGMPRPYLAFDEPAWLATFCALFLAVSLSLRMYKVAIVLALLLLVLFTRAAFIIALAALIMALPSVRNARWLRLVISVGAVVLAGFFFYRSMYSSPSGDSYTSVDTRIRDTWTIRQINNNEFFPFGASVIDLSRFETWRELPEVNNVLGFDLAWKFGIGGVILLLLWWAVIAIILPRAAVGRSRLPSDCLPIWAALVTLPASMQFNNAFGRVWLWVLTGLMLGCMTVITRENRGPLAGSK